MSLETGLAEDEAARLGAVERRLLGRMKGAIATSEPTRDALARDFGLRADALRVVVPGTDAAARVPGSGGATCEVLSIGTLIPRKGHDLLLAAMAQIGRAHV